MKKQETDKIEEQMITDLKLLKILIEVSAGKMIRLDMRRVPIIRIPTTTVTAVSTAIRELYPPAFIPVALEKDSSKVTANILL